MSQKQVEEQPIFEGLDLDKAIEALTAQGFKIEKNGATEIDTGPELMRETQHITNKDLSNGRFYHLVGDNDTNNWRPSVTTLLSILHKGHGFNQWNRNYGHLAPQVRDAAAIRGNHVHYWMKALVEGEKVMAQDIRDLIQNEEDQAWRYSYGTEAAFSMSIRRYLESFVAFWKEHNPTPIACEYPIYNAELRFAGRLDMILSMKKAKNSKKNSLVLVDLKTGGKYWTHALQNAAYKTGWDMEYPMHKIDYIASLYVTDAYRTEPTYKLDYQKVDYESFVNAARLWFAENTNSKGDVVPRLKMEPRSSFNLYRKENKTNGV